uniref:Uncharacterized protein n=1 Tax=Clastoptera arizonana TaxID=38151 RepID=A0A1B6DPE4_9HEMI
MVLRQDGRRGIYELKTKMKCVFVCIYVCIVCAESKVDHGRHHNFNVANKTTRVSTNHSVTEKPRLNPFQTVIPRNLSSELKKKHNKKKVKRKLGFWTKAGSMVATLVNGYNTIGGLTGNNKKLTRQDYSSEYSEYSDSEKASGSKREKLPRPTKMSNVEEAYRRAMTFTPRYKWDKPTIPPNIDEEMEIPDSEFIANYMEGGEGKKHKLDEQKIHPKLRRNLKGPMQKHVETTKEVSQENTNKILTRNKQREDFKRRKYKPKMNEGEGIRLKRRRIGSNKKLLNKAPWQPASYIKPILSTTGKVIRGLDTLAYYGNYFVSIIRLNSFSAEGLIKKPSLKPGQTTL